MEAPWPYTNYPKPSAMRESVRKDLARRAVDLLESAQAHGFELTIELVPAPGRPPAMGETNARIDVRPRRIKA